MERDDIIEYSLDTHHDEATGVELRKKIWKVTALLTIITIVEVALGAFIKQSSTLWELVKWSFIALTLVKAAYIVLIFMHLGDERKNLRTTVLLPMLLVVYLIFIALFEGETIIQYVQGLMK